MIAAAAMLAASDPILLRGGRIAVHSTETSDYLQGAIAQAANDEAALGQRGIGIPLRGAGGEPSVIQVLPLRRGAVRPNLVRRATAALFVARASGATPKLPSDALTLFFDLTPAECRVFELICEGRTQSEIANRLGVAKSTVKTHLLHVFEKTACKRQTDLVRLATSLSAPV